MATWADRPPLRRRLRWAADRARLPLRGPVLRAGWRLYERLLALRGPASQDGGVAPPLGQPLPPRKLRVLTVANPDVDFFVWTGGANFELIRSMLDGAGVELGSLGSVLDFGCGCGRVTRWWRTVEGPEVHGCDYNPELASWCDRNLPGVSARSNRLEPPLAYGDGSFDLVYALSIFTHLPEALQRPWVEELARVARPGGHLWLTFAGEAHAERLSPAERAAFDHGELVTQFDEVAGTNLCAAFHPAAYVTGTLLEGLEVVSRVPGSDPGPGVTLSQDAYLVRVPDPTRRRSTPNRARREPGIDRLG